MFGHHHDKRAAEQYSQEVTRWQSLHDSATAALDLARTFTGEPSDQLILQPGEAAFATVANAALVEERRGAGHYEGRSSGISVPIASIGGHAVRYHVGATKGHYVQAPPVPTAIDHGTVVVTDRRVVFLGARQTRECAFARLIGVRHSDDGTTVLSVSNRQKPTVIHYGAQLAGWWELRLDLALAHFNGTVPALVAELEAQVALVEARRPQPPAP